MILGVPTSLPLDVVERQCKCAFDDAEKKIKEDKHGLYDQSLHATNESLKFAVIKKYTTGMPWVEIKEGENRPNSGRIVLNIQIKAEQEPRFRQILKESKDTSGLSRYLGKKTRGPWKCKRLWGQMTTWQPGRGRRKLSRPSTPMEACS